MLQRRQPLGQVALVVVVDVGEVGDAVRLGIRVLAQPVKVRPQDVANRLGSVAVAAALDQRVEFVSQLVVERNREAFHGPSHAPIGRV